MGREVPRWHVRPMRPVQENHQPGLWGLCNTCDTKRRREKARQEQEAEGPAHELSPRMRKEVCKCRTKYAQFLNLMDDLGFSAAEKRVGKALVRRHLRLIEADLTEGGEFDVQEDDDIAERTEDCAENRCPPSSEEEQDDVRQNLIWALKQIGIPDGATEVTIRFGGQPLILQSIAFHTAFLPPDMVDDSGPVDN